MNTIKIAKEIQYDIERGVYDNFPVVRRQLEKVMQKLWTVNCELTQFDIQVLEYNEYYPE